MNTEGMDARKPSREPRNYRIPLRTRQQQAKVLRACKDVKTLVTINFPFKGAPRDHNALNSAIKSISDSLLEVKMMGIGFLEYNNPKDFYGRNTPHIHLCTPTEFRYENDKVCPSDENYQNLVAALCSALPWFASAYLKSRNILDIRAITDLNRLAGYLTGLNCESDGERHYSRKKQVQKVIPKKYFPLKRTMRFFGGYSNPLKNQTRSTSLFREDSDS